jgi:hypothetical protein
MGGVLAVDVVWGSEDLPLPLVFTVCGDSWDDTRGWSSAVEEGRERAQTNTQASRMMALLCVRS